jgi:hypothetical protein
MDYNKISDDGIESRNNDANLLAEEEQKNNLQNADENTTDNQEESDIDEGEGKDITIKNTKNMLSPNAGNIIKIPIHSYVIYSFRQIRIFWKKLQENGRW